MANLVISERREGGVCVITLNRPEKHNALSDELLADMADAVDAAILDDAVRAIVVTGAGPKAFCAGRDMTQGLGGRGGGRATTNVFMQLLRCEKPTIAAINGYAFGGGALLALMCDLRYANRAATFRFPGAAYGLAVATGLLAELIGPSRAKDLIYTTRVVDGTEALSLGLVNGVVDEGVLEHAIAVAATIASHSPAALAASKRLIEGAVRAEEHMAAESRENAALRTADQADRFRRATEAVTGTKP